MIHNPDNLPSAKDIGMSECEQSDVYIDYTHYMDDIEGKDWKFVFTYYEETGEWSQPKDIIYMDSEPKEPYEESEYHSVPIQVRVNAQNALKKAKGLSK